MTQTTERKPASTNNEPLRHRFTVEEFEKAYFAGAFGDRRRLELIEGEIIDMPPMGDEHIDWIGKLTSTLVRGLGDAARVFPQVPIRLEENDSQPEPDFTVVKTENFHSRKPHASEVAFVVEVSDSTLEYDRGPKIRIYARNSVQEVWIVNIRQNQLEVYRDPENETYKTKTTLSQGQTVTPLAFPDVNLERW